MAKARSLSPKTARPTTTPLAMRERIFALLDERNQQPVVWVGGPPGAGKSTMVAGYLAARNITAIWYSLDGSDADPASFFRNFDRAARAIAVSARPFVATQKSKGLLHTESFARSYFRALYDCMPRPAAIVFDNFSGSTCPWLVNTLLPIACEEALDNPDVFVVSRGTPPAALSGLIAMHRIMLLDPDALRLTREETRRLAESYGVTDEKLVDVLQDASDGWAAGAVMLLLQFRMARTTEMQAPGSQCLLADYFSSQILDRIAPSALDLLFRTALLPQVSAKAAIALGCSLESDSVLESLCRRHLFVVRSSECGPTYRYHELFRQFLISRMTSHLGTPEAEMIRARSAELLESTGAVEDATALYVAAEDWTRAVSLILAQADRLYWRGRDALLRQWISVLPSRLIESNATLLCWLALCDLRRNPATGRATLEQAIERLSGHHDELGRMLVGSAIVESYRLEWRDLHQLDSWLVEFDRFLGTRQEFPAVTVEVQILCGLLTAAIIRQPRHRAVAGCAKRLLEVLARAHDTQALEPGQIVAAATVLLRLSRSQLDFEGAEHISVTIGPVLRNNHVAAVERAFWELEYACYCAFLGDPSIADGHFDAAIQLLDQSEHRALLPIVFAWRVFSRGIMLDGPQMRSLVERLELIVNSTGHNGLAAVLFGQACMAAQQNRPEEARNKSRAALQLAQSLGDAQINTLCATLVADLHWLANETECANLHWAQALDGFSAMATQRFNHRAQILDAAMGNPDGARQAMCAALAAARKDGCPDLIRWPLIATPVYESALRHGVETDYVRQLVKQSRLVCESPEIENWPWPIRVYTLGRFAVVLGETPIPGRGKAQSKQLSLLKFVIAQGGREVSSVLASELLWPDSEGDAAQTTLDSAVHRLRKLLERDDAVLIKDGRLTLNPKVVWVDAWAFERLLGRTESCPWALDDLRMTEREGPLDAAFRLYKGHFLGQNEEQSWMIAMRAKLRSKWLRHLRALGAHWENCNHFDKAATLYQYGLEIDPLAEELYHRLIKNHQRQGRAGSAIEVANRCQHVLSKLGGLDSSDELVKLVSDTSGD